MKVLERLFDFYLDASLHVGLAVLCFVLLTPAFDQMAQGRLYGQVVFLGTMVGYNFLKYVAHIPHKTFSIAKHGVIVLVTLAALGGFIYYGIQLAPQIQYALAGVGLLIVVYPFTRNHGWIKLVLVILAVTWVTMGIPLVMSGHDKGLFFELLQRVLWLFALMIPFEIYDTATDASSMQTLPRLLGENKSKMFGVMAVLGYVIIEFFKSTTTLSVIPIGILMLVFIHHADAHRSRYYTLFWVESVPIIALCLRFLFQ